MGMCERCGTPWVSGPSSKKFCNAKCRQIAWWARTGGVVTTTAKPRGWVRPPMPRKSLIGSTSLYRLFRGRALLYVGVAKSFVIRWGAHEKVQPWWHEVTRATVEHFLTRREAEDAEELAIRNEHPKYNVVGANG